MMIRNNRASRAFAAAVAVGFLFVAGCSSSSASSSNATTTTATPKVLQILVTNDDGYDAPGIDAVVEGLRTLPDVTVTVVAPATNQSGKGGAVTAGALTATDARTTSGYPVKAVAGTPADSVNWALDQHGISITPDLVVSGINAGAHGAGLAHNIPAIAASQGPLGAPFDFPSGVQQVLAWFDANRAAIENGSITHATVFNLNIPSCPTGSVRGQVTVLTATTTDGYSDAPNCTSTATNPADDIKAYLIGYAPISNLPARAAT
jgi:5'-nucleotidase